jgi:hypothetical protein
MNALSKRDADRTSKQKPSTGVAFGVPRPFFVVAPPTPLMTTDGKLGSFGSILKPHAKEIREIARFLRTLVASLDPEAFETPRSGERCTTYGVGPRKMSEAYAHIMPLTSSVNLGFYHGAGLPDPAGLLEGTGKSSRHVKLRSVSAARAAPVKALLKAAIRERRRAQQG